MASTLLATPEALRHSLATVERGLQEPAFLPPTGPFDPAGNWCHEYRIWQIPLAPPRSIGGRLTLRRTPSRDGTLIEVQQQSLMTGQYGYGVTASIRSAADRWSTPRRWTAETVMLDPDGKPQAGSRLEFAAAAAGGEIRFERPRKPPIRVAANWTLDWTLIDALQRWPARDADDLLLDLVEDGDLLRPRQRFRYVGGAEIAVGSGSARRQVELYGFCQFGPGRLPTFYWLDQQHRLLLVIRDFSALILQSSATRQEKSP